MGLNNKLAYRELVPHQVDWCKLNNLVVNTNMTEEIIVDFRRSRPSHTPLLIYDTAVEVVSSTKVLGPWFLPGEEGTAAPSFPRDAQICVSADQMHLSLFRELQSWNASAESGEENGEDHQDPPHPNSCCRACWILSVPTHPHHGRFSCWVSG